MIDDAIYVVEGWWHPNVKSGQIHDHPEHPNGGWSVANHRLCELVYTRRELRQPQGEQQPARPFCPSCGEPMPAGQPAQPEQVPCWTCRWEKIHDRRR